MRDQDLWNQEAGRILDLIKAVQRILGLTNRDLELRLGLSTGYLSRLLNRKIALRFDHVLAIVTGLGFRLDEFFRVAYPSTAEEPSPAAREIQSVFSLSPIRRDDLG